MGFGILAAACAAIKTSQLTCLNNTAGIRYEVSPLIVAAMTEQWITLLVACLPPSRPVLKFLVCKAGGAGSAVKTLITRTESTKRPSDEDDQSNPWAMFGTNRGETPTSFTTQAFHTTTNGNHNRRNLEGGLSSHPVRNAKGLELPHADTIQGIVMRTEITVEYEDDLDDATTVRGSNDGEDGKSDLGAKSDSGGSEKTMRDHV